MAEEKNNKGYPEEREVNTDFMKEEIRQRPINRKRLVRRTLITSFLAVLFGAIACTVFILLEPIINALVYPPQAPDPIVFPEETQESEMSPEDMIAAEKELQKAETEEAVNQAVSQLDTSEIEKSIRDDLLHRLQRQITEEIRTQMEGREASGDETQAADMEALMESAGASVVTVTGITPQYDWAGEAFENTGKTSGLIIAETEEELLILVHGKTLRNVKQIRITFPDSSMCSATIRAADQITGIAVLEADLEQISEETREKIHPAVLGSSAREELLGKKVLALGAPSGTQGSVSYGTVTNADLALDITDSEFYMVSTDIYGSSQATGVLFNEEGEVIGWIDMRYNKSDSANLISAVGISEMKALAEKMSNAVQITGFGIHGTDVPDEIHEELGVPIGAYVRKVEIDSPAMGAGIQSGDVIIAVGDLEITCWEELIDAAYDTEPGETCVMTILRQGIDGYTQAEIEITGTERLVIEGND